MGVICSKDYHDYVFVNGEFIGEFEQMYQNCDDPWHQIADGLSEREPLRKIALEEIRRLLPQSILDVGCGIGYFTHQMHVCVPEAEVLGIDLSKTALEKAGSQYPDCQFQELNVLDLHLLDRQFDLIVCNEILWYILNDLNLFFKRISAVAHEKTLLLLMQYFPEPEEQQYGRDVLVGVEGLVERLPFRIVQTKEVNRLLSAAERERQGKAGSHRAFILCLLESNH